MTQLLTGLLFVAMLTMIVMSFQAGTAGGGAEAARRYRAVRPIMIGASAVMVLSAIGLVLVQQR